MTKSRLHPETRSARWLESQGYRVAIAHGKRGKFSQDLFGFADGVAVRPRPIEFGVYPHPPSSLYWQATSAPNHAARKKKITQDCRDAARDVLLAGNRILLLSWRPDREEPRGEEITLEMLKNGDPK